MKSFVLEIRFLLATGLIIASGFGRLAAQSAASPLGTISFQSYLEAAPAPPRTVEEAAGRAYGPNALQPVANHIDQYYQPLRDEIQTVEDQHKAYFAGKYQQYYQAEGQEGIRQQSAAMVNQNYVVREMGGIDKVSRMSEQQAEAAARQAAAQYVDNPFAASSVQSPGMTALYQKIMSDPAYAARFEKMSDKEKEAELRKYMQNETMAPAAQKSVNASLQQRDAVIDAMEINQAITAFRMQIQEAAQAFGQLRADLENEPGSIAAIGQEYSEKYAAIPEIIADEAGRHKDPDQVARLAREMAVRYKTRAASDLARSAAAFSDLRATYKRIVAEYQDFISNNKHRIDDSLEGLLAGTNTEMNLANLELGLLSLASDLAGQSERITLDAAAWEKHYQETMATYR